MQITQITPAANQPKKDASTALQGLGNDLDTFLTMLTTQLKNQDPTNPLDTCLLYTSPSPRDQRGSRIPGGG